MSKRLTCENSRSNPAAFALCLIAPMALAGCSSEPSVDGQNAASGTTQLAADPAGAALPLSIGGRVDAETGDAMEGAVNCAAALGLTAERLASMSDNPLSNEIALIGRAQDFFTDQASDAAAQSETAIGSVEAAIARRRDEKSAEITQQAQLAIACLRRFGDSVDPLTGEAL